MSTLILEKVFSLIVEEAVGLVDGAFRSVIHLYDEKNERLHAVGFSEKNADHVVAETILKIRVSPRNEFDFGQLSDEDIDAASMISGRGVAGLVIKEHQTIYVADTEDDDRYLRPDGKNTTRSLVVSPIMSAGRPLGTLSVLSTTSNAFDTSVELLLENMCVQAATAIENARLLEAERQAREIAEAQTEISILLTYSLELDEVLDRILDHAVRLFSATAVNILLLREGRPLVYRHSGYEFLTDQAEEYAQDRVDFIQKKIEENDKIFDQTLVIPDTEKEPAWRSTSAQHWVQSFASVPLRVGDEVVGVLNIDSQTPEFFWRTGDTAFSGVLQQRGQRDQECLVVCGSGKIAAYRAGHPDAVNPGR